LNTGGDTVLRSRLVWWVTDETGRKNVTYDATEYTEVQGLLVALRRAFRTGTAVETRREPWS
jgi:hypothetical protein